MTLLIARLDLKLLQGARNEWRFDGNADEAERTRRLHPDLFRGTREIVGDCAVADAVALAKSVRELARCPERRHRPANGLRVRQRYRSRTDIEHQPGHPLVSRRGADRLQRIPEHQGPVRVRL